MEYQRQTGTLILELYYFLKSVKVFKNMGDFLEFVFPHYLEYSISKTSKDKIEKKIPQLSRSENQKRYSADDFKQVCTSYILNEDEKAVDYIDDEKGEVIYLRTTWKNFRKEKIYEGLVKCWNNNVLGFLKRNLIENLRNTKIHDAKLCNSLMMVIERLKENAPRDIEMRRKWEKKWVDALYYYIFFAVTDKLNSDIAMSMYPNLENDLREYNERVTLMYGTSGKPGIYQTYALANRENPNIIALYECGEMEYYGTGPTREVNYQEAYRYYSKTRKYNPDHPLATWSIAYMKFHYTRLGKDGDKRYRVQEFENQLRSGKKNKEWYESIIRDVRTSYENGCPAAANLIGKILDCNDEKFPIKYRGNFRNMSAMPFYKESADAGYVFGCNNYSLECNKMAQEACTKKEKIDWLKKARYYLCISADMGNPWAANRVGKYLCDGVSIGGESIYEVDKKAAYQYFLCAIREIWIDKYFWPLINICKYFWLNEDENNEHYLETGLNKINLMICMSISALGDNAAESEILNNKSQFDELKDIQEKIELLRYKELEKKK